MAKLRGKAVGERIVEFLGPITGRNYNVNGSAAPVAPQIRVRVIGTGSVQLQEAPGGFQVSGGPGVNSFTWEKAAIPSAWANLGPVVADTGTHVVITPTIHANWTAVRALVSTVGDGQVIIETDWV